MNTILHDFQFPVQSPVQDEINMFNHLNIRNQTQ